ncbi:hypothetical protein GCM10023113_33070 [Cellulomonas oligotrophica]|uniref:LysM domain-containing protein n=1 Tax=Cellulomonas oligotrophica TaxID=931536 RepID=A0ABQ4DDX8_9CELL|nr:hypothetical protein Col01nite_30900 [Cellulomonas oligotrophica]
MRRPALRVVQGGAAEAPGRVQVAPAGTVARPRRAAPPAGGADGLRGLRLTRRGRAVVWALGLLLGAGVGGAAWSAQADGTAGGVVVERHVVEPGETLWAIADRAAAEGEDVRDVVLELMRLNDLASGDLLAGQTIVVPAR